MWLQFVLAFVFVLLVAFLWSQRKPHGIPPGLWGWPIVGAMPSGDVTLSEQVKQLRKKYGDVISWRMGSRLYIFLCDFQLMKTAFAKAETVDRPSFYSLDSFTEFTRSGVANSNGLRWANSRRFSLQHLKDMGMGKTFLGDAIQKEAQYLVEDFKKHLNKPVDLPWSINVAIMNVIWLMVAGARFDVDDMKLTKLHQLLTEALISLDSRVTWLDLYPWLIPIIPTPVKNWLGMNTIYNNTKAIRISLWEDVVREHVKNFDPNDPKDLIDAYLLELRNKRDPTSTLSMNDLCYGFMDYFGDGSSTTSLTLRWAILYLAKYPKVQERAQKEIDSVVPRGELPSLEHKDKLPYLEAFLNEVFRASSILPTGAPHETSEDIELGGYRIPKNSVIFGHLEGCHKDPAYWERPDDFYPEHFLDEDGKFVPKKEGFLPFGSGRRRCIGEALSRMELYLFLAALIQNVSFSTPEGEKLSTDKRGADRVMSYPSDFKLIITERK